MAWTKSGTVSVTNASATVYGAGTTWASAKLARAGDIFKAPDGRDYEVANVQSNTQLTLTSAYLGTTASAKAYALIHTGLLPAELAVGLSELQSKYLTTVSQLYDWETSASATVPMTNPATGITTQVKPIAGLIADIGLMAPKANPIFSGNVGVGIAPLTKFHVYSASTGTPDTSGTGVTGVCARFQSAGVNLDFGTYASGSCFIQPRLSGNNAQNYSLSLNPNGGDVTVNGGGLLGYGPGAGGTATQATSKSTVVTLNKPCGHIVMSSAVLNAGTAVEFTVNNNVATADCVVVADLDDGLGDCQSQSYNLWVKRVYDNYIFLILKNISGSNLSDPVHIKFAIIKGVTS